MNTPVPAGTWIIDQSHSEVGFTARHLMVSKVRGSFEKFSGTVKVAENFTDSKVEATIDASSVNTRDENRDTHIRTKDFFAVEEFPTWSFISTGLKAQGSDYSMDGDLTIKGVTKPITLALEVLGVNKDPWGNLKAGFAASTKVNRKDFGIEWNAPLEAGGVLVGDEVTLNLDIQAALQA
ncbi:MAG TPA: YceI family protein [Candidatus Nanopelagicaceae bacterium]|nr:YceI family protein [Candidatus Nanopelagicaceae bacterium]